MRGFYGLFSLGFLKPVDGGGARHTARYFGGPMAMPCPVSPGFRRAHQPISSPSTIPPSSPTTRQNHSTLLHHTHPHHPKLTLNTLSCPHSTLRFFPPPLLQQSPSSPHNTQKKKTLNAPSPHLTSSPKTLNNLLRCHHSLPPPP